MFWPAFYKGLQLQTVSHVSVKCSVTGILFQIFGVEDGVVEINIKTPWKAGSDLIICNLFSILHESSLHCTVSGAVCNLFSEHSHRKNKSIFRETALLFIAFSIVAVNIISNMWFNNRNGIPVKIQWEIWQFSLVARVSTDNPTLCAVALEGYFVATLWTWGTL
jgi:hypothetical protein